MAIFILETHYSSETNLDKLFPFYSATFIQFDKLSTLVQN